MKLFYYWYAVLADNDNYDEPFFQEWESNAEESLWVLSAIDSGDPSFTYDTIIIEAYDDGVLIVNKPDAETQEVADG